MARLFLIRHGEPQAAWGGGDLDPELSPEGLRQVEAVSLTLAALGLNRAVSSPMRRCQQTAAPFGHVQRLDISLEPRISEVSAPAGISDRRAWLAENFPWQGGAPVDWRVLSPALHRWRNDLLSALSELPDKTAVFTHFIAINAVVGAALGRGDTIVCRPDYASITEIETTAAGLKLVRQGAQMSDGDVR
jgi:broad specificity phosphatase PhoE